MGDNWKSAHHGLATPSQAMMTMLRDKPVNDYLGGKIEDDLLDRAQQSAMDVLRPAMGK